MCVVYVGVGWGGKLMLLVLSSMNRTIFFLTRTRATFCHRKLDSFVPDLYSQKISLYKRSYSLVCDMEKEVIVA
jgi:hypothetical protein